MNALIAQCGGPTAVFNASLAAVVERWRAGAGAGRLWGSRLGLQGLATGDWVELSAIDQSTLATLAEQPGAALGSSRYRPADDDFPRMVARLQQAAVEAVFLIGGNGTMAAVARLEATAGAAGYPLQVIGIPKTIDNDLAGTEVTPGYGSAARYIAHTTQECGLDLRAMVNFDEVAVIEVMGRHAGWLAAAAALARQQPEDPPHLILLPETPVAIDAVLARIQTVFDQRGICLVVTAEGVHDAEGRYWAELLGNAGQDASGQRNLSMAAGAAAYLAQHVQSQLGRRCRQIRLNTAQRGSRLPGQPPGSDTGLAGGRRGGGGGAGRAERRHDGLATRRRRLGRGGDAGQRGHRS